jgi:Hsp70 protein
MTYSLGIDLGTTFVAAAVARPTGIELVTLGDRAVVAPAVVYVREDGRLITGGAAERRAVLRPDLAGREVKRRLGDPMPIVLGDAAYPATSLLGAQLRDAVQKIFAAEGGPPERIVLTCPATWGPFRRELFEEVPRAAALPVMQVVTEPEAAAAHYAASCRMGDGKIVAVYDLGGGTFEATIVRRQAGRFVIMGTPEGIENLGGVDFDEAILSYVIDNVGGALTELDVRDARTAMALARLRRDCVSAKEALSRDPEAVIPVFVPGQHFEVRLTRAAFEALIGPAIESTIGALSRSVRSAGLTMSDLDAVLLVGGSSCIPLIARMLRQVGRPTVGDAHPKYPVALGAAAIAAASQPAGRRGGYPALPPPRNIGGGGTGRPIAHGVGTAGFGPGWAAADLRRPGSPTVTAGSDRVRGGPAAPVPRAAAGPRIDPDAVTRVRSSDGSPTISTGTRNQPRAVAQPPRELVHDPRRRIGRVSIVAMVAVTVLVVALWYLLASEKVENAPTGNVATLVTTLPSPTPASTTA